MIFFQKKKFHKNVCVNFLTFKGRKEEKNIMDFEEKFFKIFFVDFDSIFWVFYVQVQNFRGFGV